jgi:phosphatidylserine/phosphatidylglycerophosphate/cardiolipin synthase-like enzyme
MISQAIRNAKRYIYTEDQYFVYSQDSFLNEHDDLQKALIHALRPGGIQHFTAVLTHGDISDMPEVNEHRGDLIKSLVAAGGDRVRIFTLQPNGATKEFKQGKERHTYVHAKIWIIDDEFVSIGTPNSNRRGWSKDNEVAAGIYETSTDVSLHYRLAHWLRIDLWREHLGMDWAGANAELADGVASSVHWLKLPPTARVRQFFDNSNPSVPNFLWNTFVDPE